MGEGERREAGQKAGEKREMDLITLFLSLPALSLSLSLLSITGSFARSLLPTQQTCLTPLPPPSLSRSLARSLARSLLSTQQTVPGMLARRPCSD